VAKLARQIERQMASLADDMKKSINEALRKAQQIVTQTKHRKTKGIPKLYSWHAPEVEVIAKGKARTPYEFGHLCCIQFSPVFAVLVGFKGVARMVSVPKFAFPHRLLPVVAKIQRCSY